MFTLTIDFNTLSWDQFVNTTEPYSIALDGYVWGGPRFDNTPRANFNHHEEVDRLATRSTCAQVLMAIRNNIFTDCFTRKNEPHANIFINDCDEDVCTSWALIKNLHLSKGVVNPLLNRLVAMEDALDCTAGAYPFPQDLPALKELAWVFQPYRQFRSNGLLDKKDPEAYRCVIEDVEHRILAYITGRGKEIPLDLRYERIGGGTQWAMVREIGSQSRTGMFSDGIRTFISVKERADGRYNYVVGKMGVYNPLDLKEFIETMNQIEGTQKDSWGGGSNIVGSPRGSGSSQTPKFVGEILESLILKSQRP